jgi:hypothetical protein
MNIRKELLAIAIFLNCVNPIRAMEEKDLESSDQLSSALTATKFSVPSSDSSPMKISDTNPTLSLHKLYKDVILSHVNAQIAYDRALHKLSATDTDQLNSLYRACSDLGGNLYAVGTCNARTRWICMNTKMESDAAQENLTSDILTPIASSTVSNKWKLTKEQMQNLSKQPNVGYYD